MIVDKIIAAAVAAGVVGSEQIATTGLDIGGGDSKRPGVFRIYDGGGTLIGHIGGVGMPSGAWFKSVRIGGPDENSPYFKAENGVVTIDGDVTIGSQVTINAPLKVSKLNYDTTIDGDNIETGTVTSDKLATEALEVGGKPNRPGSLTVYDGSAVPFAYLGGAAGGTFGAWFKRVAIGGSAVDAPALRADADGSIQMIGGTIKDKDGNVVFDPSYGRVVQAIDIDGNLKLKNKLIKYGQTYGPYSGDESYSLVPEMAITVTVANAANGVMILFSGLLDVPNNDNDAAIRAIVRRDGVQVGPEYGSWVRANGQSGLTLMFIDTSVTALTAGAHTYEIWGLSFQGTGTPARWIGVSRMMFLMELG
jgi:hypothetical protein